MKITMTCYKSLNGHLETNAIWVFLPSVCCTHVRQTVLCCISTNWNESPYPEYSILWDEKRSSQSMLVDCTDCQIACYSRLTCHHKSSAQIDPYIILIFVFIVCTPSFYKTIALSIRRIGQMLITCYGVGMYLYSFVYPCRLIGVCAPKPQVS